jgi:hypothetical protein
LKRFVEGVDRGQSTLFPECLDDWVDEDNPDVFVDALQAQSYWGSEESASSSPSPRQ